MNLVALAFIGFACTLAGFTIANSSNDIIQNVEDQYWLKKLKIDEPVGQNLTKGNLYDLRFCTLRNNVSFVSIRNGTQYLETSEDGSSVDFVDLQEDTKSFITNCTIANNTSRYFFKRLLMVDVAYSSYVYDLLASQYENSTGKALFIRNNGTFGLRKPISIIQME